MYPLIVLSPQIVLPTYFTLISLSLIAGLFWLVRRAQNRGLNPTQALDLAMIMMVAGFVGGRVLHVLYEYPGYYWEDPSRVFAIWRGGFVFFGGAALACLAGTVVARRRNLDWHTWADLFAPILIVIYGVGRIASFLSGSCYGLPTSLPWGVTYPEGVEAPPGIPLHPAALYESAWSFLACAVLLRLEKKPLFHVMLILHGIGRIGLEQIRGDYRGEMIAGQSLSTWISVGLVALGIYGLKNRSGR